MFQDTNRQQSIEWLKEQLAQQEAKLTKAEELVVQLQASVTHFRGVLQVVASDQEMQISTKLLLDDLAEDESLNGSQTAADIFFEAYDSLEDESQGNPQNVKRSEQLSKTFAEAAQQILDKHQKSQDLKKILSKGRHPHQA